MSSPSGTIVNNDCELSQPMGAVKITSDENQRCDTPNSPKLALDDNVAIDNCSAVVVEEEADNVAIEIEMVTDVIGNEELVVSEEQVIENEPENDVNLCSNESNSQKEVRYSNKSNEATVNCPENGVNSCESELSVVKVGESNNTSETKQVSHDSESDNASSCFERSCSVEQPTPCVSANSNFGSSQIRTAEDFRSVTSGVTMPCAAVTTCNLSPSSTSDSTNTSSSVGLGIHKKKFGKFRILLDNNEQNHVASSSNTCLHSQESSNDAGISEDSCSFDSKSEKCSVEPFVPPTLLRQQSMATNEDSPTTNDKHSDDDCSRKSMKSAKKKNSLKKKDNKSSINKKGKIVDIFLDFGDDAANRRRSSRIKSLEERKELERAEKAKTVSEICQQVKPECQEKETTVPMKPDKEKKSKSKKHKDDKDKSRKKKNRKKKSNSHIFEDDSSEDGNKRDQKGFMGNDNSEIKSMNSDCFTPPLPPSQLNTLKNSHSMSSNVKNATSDSDESPKPEKVKSRWRRSSELESSSETSSFINSTGNRSLESFNGSISVNAQNVGSLQVPKETEPVPDFVIIEESVYLFERKKSKSKKEVRRMVCDCILTKEERNRGIIGCGDDCLNRMLMIECGSRCPLGDHCANKRFQKKLYAKVDPFKTEKKGWGLRTLQPLQAGTFIMEYVGEVLAPKDFKNRVSKYSKENRVHHYFMALKNDEIIDATYKGNLTRFVNHSCEPNAETQKWTVNGELRIGFFTKRYVEAGEEITFDYQFQRYGEKAQKCYCESSNCRGFIGNSNVTNIDIDGSRLTKTKEIIDEIVKNEDEFEDLALEEEIEKLTLSGGLRNRQQTLLLARLMVRAEDSVNRQKLLQVMKSTQEIAYLRLLLDYHGLQLLWSWMFELEDVWLKAEILEVLEILPIPNKTMLKDSKVLDVVEKWSKQIYNCLKQHSIATAHLFSNANTVLERIGDNVSSSKISEECEKREIDTHESSLVNSQIKHEKEEIPIEAISTSREDSVCEQTKVEGEESVVDGGANAICSKTESGPNSLETANKNQVDDVKDENSTSSSTWSKTVVKSATPIVEEEKGEEPKPVPNIALLTTKLLNSWKDLKEVFRIPRLERQKRHEDEKEADRRTKELEERKARGLPIIYEKNKRGIDDRDCTIAGILGLRKKATKRPADDRKVPQNTSNVSPHSTAISNEIGAPTPPKVNKDAHRMHFEMELMRKQYEEAMKEYKTKMVQYNAMIQQQIIQPQPPPQPPIHYQNSFDLSLQSPSQTTPVLPAAGQQPFYSYDNSNVQQWYPPSAVASGNSDFFPPVSEDYSQNYSFQSTNGYQDGRRTSSTLLSCYSVLIECTSDEHSLASDEKAVISVDYGVEYVPVQRPDNETTLFDPIYPAPGTYFTHGKRSYFVPQPFDQKGQRITPVVFEDVSVPMPASVTRNVISTAFPKNWRGNNDKIGNVYYYNKVTRKAQWNLPEEEMECSDSNVRVHLESVVISSADSTSTPKDEVEPQKEVTPVEMNGEHEGTPNAVNSADCSGTPVESLPGSHVFEVDPRKRKHLSNAAVNLLTTVALNNCTESSVMSSVNCRNQFSMESKTERRMKEKFKAEMSEHIKHCLNPYRKIDCRIGRIVTNDDFKYLARKLTHFVMVKELKHCKSIEDLSCNDTVKHKAKDYVKKYMAKHGPVYKIDAFEDKDDKNLSPKDGVSLDSVLEQSIDGI